jgi:hypothetical protein
MKVRRIKNTATSSKIAVLAVLSIMLATLVLSSPAWATQLRTFVASTGSDSNSVSGCLATSPCLTFATAYSVTGVGGEIVALDGAGYGPLTITNSVTIVGEVRAYVKASASSTAITINAGSSGKVILDNIEVNGAGASNTTGIALNSGHLILRNSVLTQLTTGLSVASTKADVINSDITYNTTGVSTTGTGVDTGGGFVPTAGGPTEVRLSGGSVIGNTTAFVMNNPGLNNSGSGPGNNITILLFLNSNTDVALTTYMAGNTTLVSGTGSSCATSGNCTSAVGFENQPNENQN